MVTTATTGIIIHSSAHTTGGKSGFSPLMTAVRHYNNVATGGAHGVVGKGAARFSQGRQMRIASAREPCAAVERVPFRGTRMWAGGGAGGGGECSNGSVGLASQKQEQGLMGCHHRHQQSGRGGGNRKVGLVQSRQNWKHLTLPTVLTLGRVAAVPLLLSTFYMDSRCATTATTGIFIAAAVTDWLDGYIARKMRLGTAFGAFLDPVADKLMVAATLVLLCTKPLEVAVFGNVPWLLTVPSIAIIGREITMSAVREWAASQNSRVLEAVAVNKFGKWKTATQLTALTILLATRDSSLVGTPFLVPAGVVLLYISSVLAVWSLVVYLGKMWSVLSK